MTRTIALLSLSAALLLSACGGGAGTEKNADGVRDTMRATLQGIKDKKYGEVCDLMTKEARDELVDEGRSCEETFKQARGLIKDKDLDKYLDQIDDVKVKVDGDKATASDLEGDGESTYVWSDGKWLVGPDADGSE